jgi:signal transduction histidine kinase
METTLAQLAALLTAPPGNLAYHLVLAFSIAGALSASLFQAPLTASRPTQRLHLGLTLLLAIQVILFLANSLAWQRTPFAQMLLPAADRAFTLANLLIIGWLWIFPFHLPHEKRWAALAALAAALLCWGTVALNPSLRQTSFNQSWTDVFWQAGLLLVCLAIVVRAARRRPPAWGLAVILFSIAGLGHLAQIVFPLPQGDLPGLSRLAELGAFPFLFALPGRPLFTSHSETRPNPYSQERRRHSTDPGTLKAFLDLSIEAYPSPKPVAIARAVSHALIADCCYLVAPYDPKGQITFLEGYDLIQDLTLPGLTIDATRIPTLAAALRQGQPLLENDRLEEPKPGQGIVTAAQLAYSGNLFYQPFYSRPGDPPGAQGGIVLLSPYSNREWTAEDQSYLVRALEPLSRLACRETPEPPAEEPATPPPAPNPDSVDLDALRAIQQELQETVERLQDDNERLRSAAVAAGLDLASIHFQRSGEPISPPPASSGGEALRKPVAEGDFLKLVSSLVTQMRQSVAATAGFSEMLGDSPADEALAGRVRHSTEKTRFLLEGLSRLVTLQTASEASALEWINLLSLVDQAIVFVRTPLAQKELVLRLDISEPFPAFQADEQALRQVLVSLLQNAVTVTPANGTVTICARLQAEEALAPILVLQVTDMGGGIPSKDIYRVFTTPGSAESPIRGGSDDRIGLQVARSLVQALGGRIWIEPSGEASTFSILMPVGCESPAFVRFED